MHHSIPFLSSLLPLGGFDSFAFINDIGWASSCIKDLPHFRLFPWARSPIVAKWAFSEFRHPPWHPGSRMLWQSGGREKGEGFERGRKGKLLSQKRQMRGQDCHGQVCRLCPDQGRPTQVISMGWALLSLHCKPCNVTGAGRQEEGTFSQRHHGNRSRPTGGIHHCSLVATSPWDFWDIKAIPSENARKEGPHSQPGVHRPIVSGKAKLWLVSKFYF